MWFIIGLIIIIGLPIFIVVSVNKKEKKLLETVTKSYRGTDSERKLVLKLLKNEIPAENIFHDLCIEKENGKYSQIDLVVVSNVGIIVIEVKDYSGWIFGKGFQDQWTQVLSYGKKKYRFYNPIKQNNGHIIALKNKIKQLENIPFYSIIVFYGDCELKDVSFVPNGTFIAYPNRVIDVIKTINSKNQPVNYINKNEILLLLKGAVEKGENYNVQKEHVENIKDMLGKERIFT